MDRAKAYNRTFFARHEEGSRRSAEVVLPLLLSLTGANSLVDVGCGNGTWLAVGRRLGVERMFGLDGDYVDPQTLLISAEDFRAIDLTQPFDPPDRFDLALSLEVAEHLPPERAKSFVADLVGLAPIIAFSAAIPMQGGIGHINEQWPDYWHELFAEHGYRAFDVIRGLVWEDIRVEPWYAQNIFVYARRLRCDQQGQSLPMRVVHPRLFQYRMVELLEQVERSPFWKLRTRVQLRGRIRHLFGRLGG
jgi:SAM-dependent methyltransferase